MKKVLVAVLSALLLITVVALTFKFAMPRGEIQPVEEDILTMRELPKTSLGDEANVAIEEDTGETVSEDNAHDLVPLTIEAEHTPDPTQESADERESDAGDEPTTEETPGPAPQKSNSKPLAGVTIGVDPGHQAKGNKDLEPIAPGSSTMKARVSSGTAGRYSGVAEHTVNLNVGLRLKELLEDAGARVIMTREKADVDISNVERAQLFNANKVDLGVRLHCNGSTDAKVDGAFMLVPKDKSYPYYNECVKAAKTILEAYGEATGINTNKGITYRDDQTGFNWCERPIVNIEMGHMTNKEEDMLITNKDFQKKMAQGVFNGIVEYFG